MKFMERINSDQAAALSVEMIIVIALAVFAGLALFTFILTPVRESAQGLGGGIKAWIGALITGGGSNTPQFTNPIPVAPVTP